MDAHDRCPDRRRTITRRGLLGVGAVAVAGGVVDACTPSGTRRPSAPAQHGSSTAGAPVEKHVGAAVQLVSDVRPLPTTANDIAPVAAAEQQFGLDLLREVRADGQNVVLSPSSLATALAMLQLGARGRTEDEIARVLHTSHLSAQQQALGWAALTNALSAAANSVLESANSLWQQHGFPVRPAYLAQLARYFRTGVWQVDFADNMAGSLAAINAWCAQHTHGHIQKLFDDPPSRDTVLVLANAEYFAAAWKYRFDPAATRPGPFHRATGTTTSVPFMSYSGRAAMAGTSDYLAVQLPYAGDRFAAQLVKPLRGTLDELIASLTPAMLDSIATAPVVGDAAFLMPRFTAHTFTDLMAPLKQLGIRAAFDGADFSAMTSRPVQVESVVQRDYLKVDEVGTEAAAVTGVGIQASAGRVTPAFDTPFLFLVRDTVTGVMLFAARITDPSAG